MWSGLLVQVALKIYHSLFLLSIENSG